MMHPEYKIVEKYLHANTCTQDGYKPNLNALVSSIAEVEHAIHNGSDHIGLFKTEAMFLGIKHAPDEESQFLYYKDAVEAAIGKKICFETYARSMRREQFIIQIKAILRAGMYGDVRFVIPKISSVDELLDVRLIIEEAMLDLDVNFVKYKENMPFGVLLDTPSAALITHVFAQELNFVYVDMDRLLYYTTGSDDCFHPGFIRLLRSMVRGAHREGTPIEFIGEICSNPLLIPFYITMGVDGLTADSTCIAGMRWEVNSMNKREWNKIIREIHFMGSGNDIKMTLEKKYKNLLLWAKQ